MLQLICSNKRYFILTLIRVRGNFSPSPHSFWFFLSNTETVKTVIFPDLLQSIDIGENSDGGISDCRISGQSLIIDNCHNSRTSNDIDMKLGPVTKLGKRNQNMSKKSMMSCWQIVTSLSSFLFIVNLEQTRSWIPDA